jgi:ATP-dependent Lhr-like helicase
LPGEVREWLALQQHYSQLPAQEYLLIEQCPYRGQVYLLFYSFEGRKANQTLGMLLTRRMERMGLQPLRFSITDYALSICSLKWASEEQIHALCTPDILGDELEEWVMESPMLKRAFRQVAIISGLTEQRLGGAQKTMKQATFSTDLIYDVLRRYDPGHVLLQVARQDAERDLLDIGRLSDWLMRYDEARVIQQLERVSPLAIPIILGVRSEQVQGSGTEALLAEESRQAEADTMMETLRQEC